MVKNLAVQGELQEMQRKMVDANERIQSCLGELNNGAFNRAVAEALSSEQSIAIMFSRTALRPFQASCESSGKCGSDDRAFIWWFCESFKTRIGRQPITSLPEISVFTTTHSDKIPTLLREQGQNLEGILRQCNTDIAQIVQNTDGVTEAIILPTKTPGLAVCLAGDALNYRGSYDDVNAPDDELRIGVVFAVN